MKKKMHSYSDAFRNTAFIDPEDSYKLALVKAGHKKGYLVYDLDSKEAQQWGELPSQGKTALETVLVELEVPYFTREVRQPINEIYGDGEITLYGFFAAKNSEWKHKYDETLDDGSDCRGLGEFEGYPSCCIAEFCNDYPETDMEYLEEVEAHVGANSLNEEETRLLSILPALSHYPCSLTCTESLEMGKEFLAFFEVRYPEAFNYYQDLADERMKELNGRVG